MTSKYESDLLGSLHETAVGLHKIGVIDDHEMQEYDRDCLVSNPKPPPETKSIPTKNPTPVFAK